jgi:predicted AAA+ superfamily ATPase
MLPRHFLSDLISWAKSPNRKPLIIRGARQVGKSTIVKMLADALGLNCVTINLERRPDLAELFKSNDPLKSVQLISLELKQPLLASNSLLFLDEIQATPQVLATLRYFYEDMPELPIICAGSLLEFALEAPTFSMPVGRIEYCYLGPMIFEEFLLALGEQTLYDFLRQYHLPTEIPGPIHQKLLSLLKIYWITGGMPEAIQQYVIQKDFIAVEKVKHAILETYQDDFSKYASLKSAHYLRSVFEKIPGLIAQKIKYSFIDPNVKSTVVAHHIQKLAMAKIITIIVHSACNGVPLGAQLNEKIFKLIFLDNGLLSTQLGLSFLDLHDCTELNLVHSGMLAEQFIGQHLLTMRPYYESPHLYYWQREEKSSQAEIDYVVSYRQKIIPIEVKAGKTGTLKSLHLFMQEKNCSLGVRFSSLPPSIVQVDGKSIWSLPLYLVSQLPRLLAEN